MDVQKLASQMVLKSTIENQFRNRVASRVQLDHFMSNIKTFCHYSYQWRHRILVQGFHPEEFLDILNAEVRKTNYSPERIFNVDETGLTIDMQQIGTLTATKRESLCSHVCCMSASGILVPLMVIFPRKKFTDILMQGATPGSIGRAYPSG